MTKFSYSDKKITSQSTDGLVFFVTEDFSCDKDCAILSKTYFPHLKQLMKDHKFTGKLDETCVAQGSSKKGMKYLLFVGLGKKKKGQKHFELEEYRRAMSTAAKLAERSRLATIAVELPSEDIFGFSSEYLAQQTTTITMMTRYHFDEFLSKGAKSIPLKEVVIVAPAKYKKGIVKGIKVGGIVGDAVNRTRLWVDLPANVITPPEMAKRAKKLAKENKLKCTVFDETKVEKMGMGGLKAVGMGSQYDSQLIILEYKSKKKNAPTLALVGKGITFDSGGLNIKPTGYMETMKTDMTGGAAVINAMVALSKLNPDVNVVGVAACAENMVSGSANRPGDILTFYNGKTAVVGNTDAEGRLVLADALAYTSKNFKPTAMIDVATLTGGVAYAIGPFYNGVLTQDEKLAEHTMAAGDSSGDATWRLPLIDRYKTMVRSDIADINNNGKSKYYASATNGACFLSHFVGDTPWVHVDIAASSYEVPDTPYYRGGGATGSGTRLLIDFVMQWQ